MWVKLVFFLVGILCIGFFFFWVVVVVVEDGEDEMDDMMEDYFEYYM